MESERFWRPVLYPIRKFTINFMFCSVVGTTRLLSGNEYRQRGRLQRSMRATLWSFGTVLLSLALAHSEMKEDDDMKEAPSQDYGSKKE